MSVWSSATGTVEGAFLDHFSLKKHTKSLGYDEVVINVDYSLVDANGKHPKRVDTFYLSVCLDGMKAMEFFSKWMEGIPGKVDMTVELRMNK